MRWMLSPDWLPEWARWVFVLFWVKRFCLGCFTTNGIALTTSCLFWMNEWRVVDDRTTDVSSYKTFFNLRTVSSDVSIQDIQRRQWQPLSVHLWAYCTHPAHYVNDVMCEGWPQHRGLRPLLFSNSGVGSFTSHENQISVSAVRGDLRCSSLSEKTRKSAQQTGALPTELTSVKFTFNSLCESVVPVLMLLMILTKHIPLR